VPSSNPQDLARIVRALSSAGAKVVADAQAKLLLLLVTDEELERAERLVYQFESPLPCRCAPELPPAIKRAEAVGSQAKLTLALPRAEARAALLDLCERAGVDLAPTRIEGEVSLRVRALPAREALQSLADALGGAQLVEGKLSVGAADDACREPLSVKVVALAHREAPTLLPIARELIGACGAADLESAHNALVLRDTRASLAIAEAVLRRLDFAPDPATNPCGCQRAGTAPQ